MLPVAASPATTRYYVALGDSVAAGEGLQNLAPPDPCHRSTLAYPALLAANPSFVPAGTPTRSVACTGATTGDVLSRSETVNGTTVPSQLSQIARLPLGTVTLTVGVDDLRWVNRLTTCLTQGYLACKAMSTKVLAGITKVKAKIATIVTDLRGRGARRVIVTGYYDAFPSTAVPLTGGPCGTIYATAINNALANGTVALIRSWESHLNKSLSAAATGHGAIFVSLRSAIPTGHRICTSAEWLFPLTTNAIARGAAMHPNTAGQASIAAHIAASA